MSCCIERIITFREPMVYHKVSIVNDFGVDYTANCKFSWSDNGVCWSEWATMYDYDRICPNLGDFFLRIIIADSLQGVFLDSLAFNCYSIELYGGCVFDKNACDSPNLFDPYANLQCAIMLQEQLANNIICMFGTPIYYFKVNPKKETADYTFKEYVLHEVESVKQIKMIFPDGTLPSSKPIMNEFDFEYAAEWEVELSKKQFATAFGDTVIPMQRDIIYCPLTQRMYEVNAAYEERNEGLMYQSTTWKLALITWENKTNVDQGDIAPMIDSLIAAKYEEVFFPQEQKEQYRESGIGQTEAPKYAANTLYNIFIGDAIRKQAAVDSIEIGEQQINHKSVQIAYNYYMFEEDGPAIVYQKQYCGDQGTAIMLLSNEDFAEGDWTLFSIGDDSLKMKSKMCDGKGRDKEKWTHTISWRGIEQDIEEGTYMIVVSWSRDLMVNNLTIIPRTLLYDNIPEYKIKPQFYKFNFDVPTSTSMFNMEQVFKTPVDVTLYGCPLKVHYFKLFDNYMSKEQYGVEALKYTTNSEYCIINDCVRPIEGSEGFSVK